MSTITKIHRQIYARMYPTVVVLANGASVNVRYHEPRKIIKVGGIFFGFHNFSNLALITAALGLEHLIRGGTKGQDR